MFKKLLRPFLRQSAQPTQPLLPLAKADLEHVGGGFIGFHGCGMGQGTGGTGPRPAGVCRAAKRRGW